MQVWAEWERWERWQAFQNFHFPEHTDFDCNLLMSNCIRGAAEPTFCWHLVGRSFMPLQRTFGLSLYRYEALLSAHVWHLILLCIALQKPNRLLWYPCIHLTPLQICEKLMLLAADIPADSIKQFKDLLTLKWSQNGGIAVTDDLKYNSMQHFHHLFSTDSCACS